ncbi:MAG: VWA domain-containing protein [Planctomycetota bacterium]
MNLEALSNLSAPYWLAFAIPAAVFVVVLAFVGIPRTRPIGWVLLAMARFTLLAGLLILLARPTFVDTEVVPGRLEIYLDVSRSMGAKGRVFSREVARRLTEDLREKSPRAEVAIFGFAGEWNTVFDGPAADFEARTLEVLDDPDWRENLDPLASRLWPVLAARASRRFRGGDLRRLIIGDGGYELPPSLDPGFAGTTQILTPPLHDDQNLRALTIELPEFLREEEGLTFSLYTESSVKRRVPARVLIDGQETKRIIVTVEKGAGVLRFGSDDLRLRPGIRRVAIQLEAHDDEALDDTVWGSVRVVPKTDLLYVRGQDAVGVEGRDPAPLRALRAQDRPLIAIIAQKLERDAKRYSHRRAIVLDRLGPGEVDAEQAAALVDYVKEGGGILFLPRGGREELLSWNDHALASILPLRGRPEPRPKSKPPEAKIPDPPKDAPKKLAKADPNRFEEKTVEAPTLIVMLVIDKSPSMRKGGRLANARRGAIATARKMHPEDRLGVVTYNESAHEVVPIQEVANLEAIEREVMRIRSGGRGTDIEKALLLAQDLLGREEAAVKSVILLSDGFAIPFNIEATLESMVDDGISVSTVGVGSEFGFETLTKIAVSGRGTGPIPARSAREIPSVLVDLTSGIIKQHKARSRKDDKGLKKPKRDNISRPEVRVPNPAAVQAAALKAKAEQKKREEKERLAKKISLELDRKVVYTEGLPWPTLPLLDKVHTTGEKSGAWVSVRTHERRPFFAHWRVGEGFVAMLAAEPEGSAVGNFPLWDGYGVFMAQVCRFLESTPGRESFKVAGLVDGKQVLIQALDLSGRRAPSDWTFEITSDTNVGDQDQPALRIVNRQALDDSRWLVELNREPGPGLLKLLAKPNGKSQRVANTLLVAPPPREVRRRGLDLEGLEAWSRFLAAPLVTEFDAQDSFGPMPGERAQRFAAPAAWLGWLVLLFMVELAAKRWLRRREAT